MGLRRVAGWGERKEGMQLGLREPTFWWVRRTASPDTEAGLRAGGGLLPVARAPSASPGSTHRSINQPH